jgi:hypothetical protein
MFKVGDSVKFINYEDHGDWRDHRDQVGTILEIFGDPSRFRGFTHSIIWSDNEESHTYEKNLIRVNTDWDQ